MGFILSDCEAVVRKSCLWECPLDVKPLAFGWSGGWQEKQRQSFASGGTPGSLQTCWHLYLQSTQLSRWLECPNRVEWLASPRKSSWWIILPRKTIHLAKRWMVSVGECDGSKPSARFCGNSLIDLLGWWILKGSGKDCFTCVELSLSLLPSSYLYLPFSLCICVYK